MKHNTMLTVASLLSILFLTLHITDDIVRGISKAESSNTALLVLAVFLYGTLVLPERRSGHVIMLLIGLFAAAMPVMHMRGAHYGEIAKSPGGFFFVWTLWALGGLGGFTLILSARGLWDLRRRPAPVVQGNGRWRCSPVGCCKSNVSNGAAFTDLREVLGADRPPLGASTGGGRIDPGKSPSRNRLSGLAFRSRRSVLLVQPADATGRALYALTRSLPPAPPAAS